VKVLIQRVSSAHVEIEGKIIAKIDKGLLAFVGVEKKDNLQLADKMIYKILSYRVFPDNDGKMNLSLNDIKGEILLVSQFTLAADTKNGTRAGFSTAKSPQEAEIIYNHMIEKIKLSIDKVETGIFAADMKVSLVNDGPVTFLLKC